MKLFLLILLCLCGLTWTAPAAEPDAYLPYKNEPVENVLALYGKLTGKTVILDVKVQGIIPLFDSTEHLSDEKKIALIERSLFLNGFTLVDAGTDSVKVMAVMDNPRTVGLPIYSKPEELPRGERVFSYVLKLEHRDALPVAGVLQQYIPPNNVTAFNADPGSRTLIVTGTTDTVRNVLRLIPMLDVPSRTGGEDKDKPPAPPPADPINYLLMLTLTDTDQPPVTFKTVFAPGKVLVSPPEAGLDFVMTAEPSGDGFLLDYVLRLTDPSTRGEKKPRTDNYTARVHVTPGKTLPLVQTPGRTFALRVERAEAAK